MVTGKLNERAWEGTVKASGSDLFANALCEGRFQADMSFPDKTSADAISGSRSHTYMEEGTPLDEIDDDNERFAVMVAREMEERVVEHFGLNGKVEREPRLWCKVGGDGKFSGCIDRLEIDGTRASIIDYKMLYGRYQPAKLNKQLQVYSVLVFDNYPDVETCYLGLIQPMLGESTTASVSRHDAMELKKFLVKLTDRITSEDPKRQPGAEQCKWCSALAHCPEAHSYILEILNNDDMESVNNEKLAEKMAEVPLLDRFVKQVKGLVRDRLEKDIEVPGYKLRSSGKVTSFDARKAGEILFDANLKVEDFLECCSIKEPKLVAKWAKLTGLPKAEARKDLRLRLEDCMNQKAKAKSVSAS